MKCASNHFGFDQIETYIHIRTLVLNWSKPTMPIPKDYPLETFDPRMKELLLRGATEEITIPCRSPSEAHRLQFNLNLFRRRMREQHAASPELWKPLFTAVVGIRKDPNGKKTIVHIHSRHHEFDAVLQNIQVSDGADGRSADPPVLSHDPLEDLLYNDPEGK